jgi:16S rRNA (guanine1207-N2)-methyltransferase
MSDIALTMLIDAVRHTSSESVLWVADEQTDIDALITFYGDGKKPFLLTQRYDQIRKWRLKSGEGVANDYDFSAASSVEKIFFRIAKEKALLHYIVNQALTKLPVNGELYLAGAVNEGAKSLFEKLRDFPQLSVEVERGDKKTLLGKIIKIQTVDESLLDDREYADWFELQYDDPDEAEEMQTFVSKAGIYGWDKLDIGTELLWKTVIEAETEKPFSPQSVLDLGCGYGWLIVQAGLQWPEAKLVATDNNVTALMAVQQNTYRFGLQAEVIAADAGDEIAETFDLILCNPPFHQGFDVEGDLTVVFLKAAARLLDKKGQAFFVVNSFIPLEKKASGIFKRIELMDDNRKFKIVRLSNS